MCFVFFFFKQKTAYGIPKRDWSSDVCSSDLSDPGAQGIAHRSDEGAAVRVKSHAVPSTPTTERSDFIRDIVTSDPAAGKHGVRVATRFPPEPNGYLHIGHAKSICLNFGIAADFSGSCNLRFDDTNPVTEDVEYVESIEEDVRWLGFDWGDRLFYASDYFERLYACAEQL